ncbi:MAG: DUF4159 domain-containing protein [Deltaproteobacteria bacterium]|nr:DUF4159 domain-containing protein [Deltaproteobacteria bacterium]
MTRRGLLALAALLAARRALAFGEASQLDVAEIQLERGTISRPNAWTRLLFELIQTTSVECNPRSVAVAPDDPELFAHPFAVLVGDGAFPALSERARAQLVRYLSYGGFLLVDDASGEAQGPFDQSVRALLASLFPTRPLAVLSSDHSVYRSFFLLKEPVGRLAARGVLEGIQLGSMHPVIYSGDDLSGALDRREDGLDRFACNPGGELQRREAIKLAVNVVMYALTSNYKHDQAHVRALMDQGRIE